MSNSFDQALHAGIPQIDHQNVVAACLAVLTREVHSASLEKQAAFDLLRDAPDKIESALTRGQNAFVVYRLDIDGARGIVSDIANDDYGISQMPRITTERLFWGSVLPSSRKLRRAYKLARPLLKRTPNLCFMNDFRNLNLRLLALK